jgi:hypothetical protein
MNKLKIKFQTHPRSQNYIFIVTLNFTFVAALNSGSNVLENTRSKVQWLQYAPLRSAHTVYLLCAALGMNSGIDWFRTQCLLNGTTSEFLHTVR